MIKILIGLFIWLALPELIFRMKSKKKSSYKKLIAIVCAIVGFLIIALGTIELIKSLFHL
jgi:predicted permease